jgi:hypothetical protein
MELDTEYLNIRVIGSGGISMLLSDDTYEKMILFTKERSSHGELDFTISDLRRAFPDIDPAEILAKLHLLKDEWIINEVSPNCYTINKILLDPIQLKAPARSKTVKKTKPSKRNNSKNGRNGKRRFVLTK